MAFELEQIQKEYTHKIDQLLLTTFDTETDKRRTKIMEKFNISKISANRTFEEQELVNLAEGLTSLVLQKQVPRRLQIKHKIKKIINKLRLRGYLHPLKDKASGNPGLQLFTNNEIVKKYNSIISGILNFYSGVGNISKIKGICMLLRQSCALTLANKHKKSRN
jgi:predicted AAA+ superfamily ATPase